MASREKILERIQKLLELGKSSNEFEAGNANAEAQRLLSKHQIDQAELDSKNHVQIDFGYSTIDTGVKSNILWKSRLVASIAEVNNCQFFTNKEPTSESSRNNPERMASRSTTYTVYGSKPNVELVIALFGLISNQIEWFAKQFPGKGKSEFNSFKLGMATRIGQRLSDTKAEVIKEHIALKGNQSTALVFLDKEKEEVKKYVKELFESQGLREVAPAKRKVNLRQEAYQAGIKKGDDVVLANRKALK